MNKMIDKAERAIRTHRHSTTEVQAREAIRAIREPNEAMLNAAAATDVTHFASKALWDANRAIWHAMIDAILEGR